MILYIIISIFIFDNWYYYVYSGIGDDTLDGGEGDDFLSGDAGKDRFIYDNIGDGDDLIFDFQVGTGADADVLDLAALLSYNQGDDINDFISFIDSGINSTTINITLYIDADGNASGTDVSIYLVGVTGTELNTMINDGNIVLL